MQFAYSKLLPIRLIQILTLDQRYQNKPFDLDDSQCYEQKFQTNDSTRMQFLSDYDFTFKIYDLLTGEFVTEIIPEDKDLAVTDQTFKVFEVEFDFNLLPEGHYYVEVEVFDGPDRIELHQSEPISVKDFHPHTLLFEYRNIYAKSDTIFYDGFISTIRVEGGLNEFTPAFEDVSFIDQQFNNTLLSSVTYRLWTLYIGNAEGVPDWIGDRFNDVLSLDTVKIDGVYYQKSDGAKWSENRESAITRNQKTFAGYSIQVMPVTNVGENIYQVTPKNPDDEIRMIPQEIHFPNTGSTIRIANVFKASSVLWFIHTISEDAFTMKVGTTSGGAEIATFSINPLSGTTSISELLEPFEGITTVYISGFDGVVADVRVMLLQLDAPPLNGTINPYRGAEVGTCVRYIEVNPGDLARDFNLSTGLGNAGTGWADWGVNGVLDTLPDEGGKLIMGYSETDYPLQVPVNGVLVPNTGGQNKFKLTGDQLPASGVSLFANYVNPTGGDTAGVADYVARARNAGAANTSALNYEMSKAPGSTSQFVGKSANLGIGADIDNLPEYIVSLWVTRIVKTI